MSWQIYEYIRRISAPAHTNIRRDLQITNANANISKSYGFVFVPTPKAYHIIFRYLSPNISVHVAGLETSRELWNELEERYRRMELATFCELFAQLRETTAARCASTREFVDRVRLLVHRLNAIAPGSIGDRAHIAILLTQIGPEYVLVVDAIQNTRTRSIRRRLETVSLMPSRRCSERTLLRSRTERQDPQATPLSTPCRRPQRNAPTVRSAAMWPRSAGRNSANSNRQGTMPSRRKGVFLAHQDTICKPYHQARGKNGRARRLPRDRGSIS